MENYGTTKVLMERGESNCAVLFEGSFSLFRIRVH